MFKPNCGRKLESVVWEYFVYDAASDKSRCNVSTRDCGDDDAVKHECGKLLNGKNATNLTNHLRCVHKDVFNAMEQKKNYRNSQLIKLQSFKRNWNCTNTSSAYCISDWTFKLAVIWCWSTWISTTTIEAVQATCARPPEHQYNHTSHWDQCGIRAVPGGKCQLWQQCRERTVILDSQRTIVSTSGTIGRRFSCCTSFSGIRWESVLAVRWPVCPKAKSSER